MLGGRKTAGRRLFVDENAGNASDRNAEARI
jgi:hypothetical protein